MRIRFAIIALLLAGAPVAAADLRPPDDLPRYDFAIHLDVAGHRAHVTQQAVWINKSDKPVQNLVFNVHSHFTPPQTREAVLKLAKLIELFRLPWREAVYYATAFQLQKVERLRKAGDGWERDELKHQWNKDLDTALMVALPDPVPPGGSVAVSLSYTLELPQKQGRWGQWDGVTFLSNWHPVLAYHDGQNGWQPSPFIPWHQPWFNEAGVFTARVRVPTAEQVACTGSITRVEEGPDTKDVFIGPVVSRDFALLTSRRYVEFATETTNAGGPPVKVKCLAFPEHEHYAKSLVGHAARAIENFSKWMGPFPYPEFTIAESFFGWNGNECGGLVMIDERVFGMPHLADNYVQYLISHETCHQWIYNVVGTHGYKETFMDEALVTHLSHRLMDRLNGKNNDLLNYPPWLGWLPGIKRDDYRYAQFYLFTRYRQVGPAVQDLEKYGTVIGLFASVYDRGSKIVGVIEDRLGPAAFEDFLRRVYRKYYFRILRVSDFQRELEEYTGRKWDEFFQDWMKTAGMSDWAVDGMTVKPAPAAGPAKPTEVAPAAGYKVEVVLSQRAEINEETTLGFSFDGGTTYPVRVPVRAPRKPVDMPEPPADPAAKVLNARFTRVDPTRVRVEVDLPAPPTQVSVDPDQVLPDDDPANNHSNPPINHRPKLLYTFLDETGYTNAYDRWNLIYGPWAFAAPYDEGWFTRLGVVGARVGAYRLEEFKGGVYAGYRPYYGDVAIGADARWLHVPWTRSEIGFEAEMSVAKFLAEDDYRPDRAALFLRYIVEPTSSLYWLPREFWDVYAAYQSNWLPDPRQARKGEAIDPRTQVGVRYFKDELIPYWDWETGYRLDGNASVGVPLFGETSYSGMAWGQASGVVSPPEGMGWLSEVKLAARAFVGVGFPKDARLFTLGGSLLFRGFDISERQGSCVWVGSVELRVPLKREVNLDVADRMVRLKHVSLAPFYDVGDVYLDGRSVGPVAHAVGVGLRFDIVFFSFLERATLRVDAAQAIGPDTPTQYWFGLQQPF